MANTTFERNYSIWKVSISAEWSENLSICDNLNCIWMDKSTKSYKEIILGENSYKVGHRHCRWKSL